MVPVVVEALLAEMHLAHVARRADIRLRAAHTPAGRPQLLALPRDLEVGDLRAFLPKLALRS